MANQHQRHIRPVIHQRPSGGSIHSSDEDQHPSEISPLGQRTSTSASDTRQRDRSYFATGRPGPPRSGRENLAPTEDPRTHRRSSAPGRGDTSAAQSSVRGRGGLTVPRPQTQQRAASTGYQYDWYIFGAEAPHCHPDDSSPNSDNYHKQWVPVRKGEPLPSAESLLRKYVPQAVSCPIKDADGIQTGLMDFWSCGDLTCTECLEPYKEIDFGKGLEPDTEVRPRPKVALWEVFDDDPTNLSLWVKRPFTTHQGSRGVPLHCLGTQQQSEEARAHFASRHKQAIEDYEQAAYAYHRSNLSTGKVYAGSASRIDSCVADLDKDIRSLTNIINTLHDKVTSAGESAGRVGSSLSLAQVLATILPSIEAARSTLDGMPSRDAITKETAKITHCTTAQRDILASVKDREYKAGRRAAEDEFGSHLAPASRRESRDSRHNSSGRNRSRDCSGRSSGNSGSGRGTRRDSEY